MSKTIINGIDVSEEIRYCNNCSNLGLDFKARKFYCSLSHRPDELPEILSCDEFNTNCYIKRLQEENEELKKRCEEWALETVKMQGTIDGKDFKIDKYKQALEEIRNITEKLITELPEYPSCYYKDECGDNCTPKKQSKVEYCCYENVDKILTIINEVLNNETTR